MKYRRKHLCRYSSLTDAMKGLYVHIPFCRNKCPYCDFNSYAGREDKMEAYFSGLKKEAEEFRGENICTVYIGGGTPSIADEKLVSDMLGGFYENFRIDKNAEITIEANPATLSESKLKAYLDCGINRISIGVQSFNDEMLKKIGRIHNADEAYEAVLLTHKSGFENISCDFMFALPGQTVQSLKADLEKAAKLPITHISCYGLKIEEGTQFYKNNIRPADEELYIKMYDRSVQTLEKYGFKRYEISNFAKNGLVSRHNMLYWQCREYIGLGAGAHSYINGRRYSNVRDIDEYLHNFPKENIEILTERDKLVEKLIMGMRLSEGVEKDTVKQLGTEKKLDSFIKNGFVQENNEKISFTPKGINVSNYILSELI